ncbi:hypothetical protein I302_108281 [Kwoniella bestiolae CBS 10118]|uniref:Uncharacterized protein n=1 Tax=Kwoniella bestiolae CBS 10118 TaxID=1296100 RepID=A0A1B9FW73_9TREE|nr:hypothetical protein I302_07351 [Kwoniella bestiolae CBS 10118]OCF23001.1 hypothetical protein I302_07351 [Kwoniella bestiolae CBS 10118]
MSRTFMDLTDPVIHLIGSYLNNDSDLAMPSFTPFWENYASEIRPDVVRDFFAFRATCRRVRDVCKVGGLHLVIKSWHQVERLLAEGSAKYLEAVGRARISIIQTQMHDIVSLWSSFTLLLSRMTSLEELILDNLPFCQHARSPQTDTLQLPPYPILPKVISLSIDPRCNLCANAFNQLFIPAAPNIKHLRFRLAISKSQPSRRTKDNIEPIMAAWRKANDNQVMLLQTLCIRLFAVPRSVGKVQDYKDVCQLWPTLTNLHVSRFSDSDHKLQRVIAFVEATPNDPPDWLFRCYNADGPKAAEDDLCFQSIPQLCEWLELPQTLQELDLNWVISLNLERPLHVSPVAGQRRGDPLPAHDPFPPLNTATSVGQYESRMKEAISSAALQILDSIPALERGFFWEDAFDGYKQNWYRWTWEKTVEKDDMVAINVCDNPQLYSEDFLTCRPGGL